jgi:hypothetical protein
LSIGLPLPWPARARVSRVCADTQAGNPGVAAGIGLQPAIQVGNRLAEVLLDDLDTSGECVHPGSFATTLISNWKPYSQVTPMPVSVVHTNCLPLDASGCFSGAPGAPPT